MDAGRRCKLSHQILSCFKISSTRLIALQCEARARTKTAAQNLPKHAISSEKNQFSGDSLCPSPGPPRCEGYPLPTLHPRSKPNLLDPPFRLLKILVRFMPMTCCRSPAFEIQYAAPESVLVLPSTQRFVSGINGISNTRVYSLHALPGGPGWGSLTTKRFWV